jgi:predicted helicase
MLAAPSRSRIGLPAHRQHQISLDKRSGITSDPNNPDDEEYIVRLVGQLVRVSLETVKIVKALPAEYSPP